MGVTAMELRDTVSGNVRAALARASVSPGQVGEVLGHDRHWVTKRLHGRVPWALEDLVTMAESFGLDPDELWRGVPGGIR